MKKIFYYSTAALFVCLICSCFNNNEEKPSTLCSKDFASSSILIKVPYNELVNRLGMPDTTSRVRYYSHTENGSYTIDSCDLLMYKRQGLSYIRRIDSSFLYFMDYNADYTNTLTYKDQVLDRFFSIVNAEKYFSVPESCFVHLYGEYEMCGLDTAGFGFF